MKTRSKEDSPRLDSLANNESQPIPAQVDPKLDEVSESVRSSTGEFISSSILLKTKSHRKSKKHKHKKHKRKRELSNIFTHSVLVESGPISSTDLSERPQLKLKIKFGGETLTTKSVSRSSVTDAITEAENFRADGCLEGDETLEDEDALSISDGEIIDDDDEEAWLQALEAGELNEHGELKKEKDVNLLTARQKALLQVKEDDQQHMWEMESEKPSIISMTDEMIKKRALRAQRRRDQAQKKDLENKKQTIERLLKKQEVKSKLHKSNKSKKKMEGAPRIHYVHSLSGSSLSYPVGMEFPLKKSIAKVPRIPVMCGVEGCGNLKKYSCSKTGIPLCSLECYNKNLTNFTNNVMVTC